jgi:hypothetical protein
MYSIRTDQRNNIIHVKLSGLMCVFEVSHYIGDLQVEFTRHNLRDYAMVIDVTECPIQSQDMIRSMRYHMVSMPKARALAIVTGSSLARIQVRKLFTQPYARTVGTIDAGIAWVLNGIEPLQD